MVCWLKLKLAYLHPGSSPSRGWRNPMWWWQYINDPNFDITNRQKSEGLADSDTIWREWLNVHQNGMTCCWTNVIPIQKGFFWGVFLSISECANVVVHWYVDEWTKCRIGGRHVCCVTAPPVPCLKSQEALQRPMVSWRFDPSSKRTMTSNRLKREFLQRKSKGSCAIPPHSVSGGPHFEPSS